MMSALTQADRDKLRALHASTTNAPWNVQLGVMTWRGFFHYIRAFLTREPHVEVMAPQAVPFPMVAELGPARNGDHDAQFMVAAHTLMPCILNELDRLELAEACLTDDLTMCRGRLGERDAEVARLNKALHDATDGMWIGEIVNGRVGDNLISPANYKAEGPLIVQAGYAETSVVCPVSEAPELADFITGKQR